MEVLRMHEAYRPIIEDGRGRFSEDLRVSASCHRSADQAHLIRQHQAASQGNPWDDLIAEHTGDCKGPQRWKPLRLGRHKEKKQYMKALTLEAK